MEFHRGSDFDYSYICSKLTQNTTICLSWYTHYSQQSWIVTNVIMVMDILQKILSEINESLLNTMK